MNIRRYPIEYGNRVVAAGYSDDGGILELEFPNHSVRQYFTDKKNNALELYIALAESPTPDLVFDALIKGRFKSRLKPKPFIEIKGTKLKITKPKKPTRKGSAQLKPKTLRQRRSALRSVNWKDHKAEPDKHGEPKSKKRRRFPNAGKLVTGERTVCARCNQHHCPDNDIELCRYCRKLVGWEKEDQLT